MLLIFAYSNNRLQGKSRISTRKSHKADKAHPQGNQSFLLESSTPASSFHFHSLSLHSRLEAPQLQMVPPLTLFTSNTKTLNLSSQSIPLCFCHPQLPSELHQSIFWMDFSLSSMITKGRLGWPGSLETRNETWVPSGSHSAQDQTNNRPIISHHQRREAWLPKSPHPVLQKESFVRLSNKEMP